ncbi:MAG: DUF4126 domain-containing protein [Mobiluncus porci]|uniref:DUF4126 domain-containing protein n=1 Tax=Mobiluncus porci TaxID=2652278 RepID=A0A7K0K4D9_9ACTO|nr:DUF4126 domain-containing protein [Mobiluncus porci]MDD7541911.1 DUF4126 domain-containing protein [Mobiluncus porci]MDY5749381.1 DUF4126 domain-containing protein [Mobiluncus porci]MST50278.1 DUF4126 domain-containing protein [Mobiluncus porci]
MLATLTGLGLSAAAGLNAYIPFLVVALVARFTDVINLPSEYVWIESPWAIGIAAVLLLAEIFLDKVPAVDTLNDAVGTVIRPLSGGLIFAATSAAQSFEENSTFMTENTWIGIILGVVVALIVHSGKAVSRPVLNTTTAGFAAPVASAGEDTFSVAMSLSAVFLPVLVIAFLIILGGILFVLIRKTSALATRRGAKDSEVAEADPQ